MAKANSSRLRRLASRNCPHNQRIASVARNIIRNGQTAEGCSLAARQGVLTLRVNDLVQGIPHCSGSVWHGPIAQKRQQQLHLMLWHPPDRACGKQQPFRTRQLQGRQLSLTCCYNFHISRADARVPLHVPEQGDEYHAANERSPGSEEG